MFVPRNSLSLIQSIVFLLGKDIVVWSVFVESKRLSR
jgi:hypothetical protein